MSEMMEPVLGLPLPLNGSTRLYAILGDPIAQVGSPGLFNAAFRRKGVGAVLFPYHIGHEGLDQLLAAFRTGRNFDGLVVTMPHKISILERLDDVGPMGRRVGAVNAVRKMPDGQLIGDNFDGAGFVRGLSRNGHVLTGRRVLVLGAGGAGSAVAHAIMDEAPAAIGIYDPDQDRLHALVRDLAMVGTGVDLQSALPDAEGYDVVVNCTSVGMKLDDPLPLSLERLSPATLVVDIILQPETSRLLFEAERLGCPIQRGIHMLEGQVEEVCRFFGLPEDADATRA